MWWVCRALSSLHSEEQALSWNAAEKTDMVPAISSKYPLVVGVV